MMLECNFVYGNGIKHIWEIILELGFLGDYIPIKDLSHFIWFLYIWYLIPLSFFFIEGNVIHAHVHDFLAVAAHISGLSSGHDILGEVFAVEKAWELFD